MISKNEHLVNSTDNIDNTDNLNDISNVNYKGNSTQNITQNINQDIIQNIGRKIPEPLNIKISSEMRIRSNANVDSTLNRKIEELRQSNTPYKILPKEFINCDKNDLITIISRMLSSLIKINDQQTATDLSYLDHSNLTRFHSRSPPQISVYNYLARLSQYSSLENSILITAVYYIDLLSLHYPIFAINSLTVHRFLLTSTTIASKALCDSFCSNTHYAKVGGVNILELNLLEVEFLNKVGYRVVPRDFNYDSIKERKNSTGAIDEEDFKSINFGLKSAEKILDVYYKKMVMLVGGGDKEKGIVNVGNNDDTVYLIAEDNNTTGNNCIVNDDDDDDAESLNKINRNNNTTNGHSKTINDCYNENTELYNTGYNDEDSSDISEFDEEDIINNGNNLANNNNEIPQINQISTYIPKENITVTENNQRFNNTTSPIINNQTSYRNNRKRSPETGELRVDPYSSPYISKKIK